MKVDVSKVSLTGVGASAMEVYQDILRMIASDPECGRAHKSGSTISRTKFGFLETGGWVSVTYWWIKEMNECKIIFVREHALIVQGADRAQSSIMDQIEALERSLAEEWAREAIGELLDGKIPV